MNLNEFLLKLNLGDLSVIFFLVLSLIQIAPIKINPWSMLLQWIARLLGIIELKDRMNELERKIDQLKVSEEEKYQLKEALEARRRILRFNDELLQNVRHSKEMFDDILKDITDYDNYCQEHPKFVNKKAVLSEQNVAKAYQKCMADNDFL